MVLRVRRARGMCAGDAGVRASCAPQQRGPHAKRDARAEPEKGVRFLRRHVTVRAIKVIRASAAINVPIAHRKLQYEHQQK